MWQELVASTCPCVLQGRLYLSPEVCQKTHTLAAQPITCARRVMPRQYRRKASSMPSWPMMEAWRGRLSLLRAPRRCSQWICRAAYSPALMHQSAALRASQSSRAASLASEFAVRLPNVSVAMIDNENSARSLTACESSQTADCASRAPDAPAA